MFQSLQARLIFLFVAFVLLVVVSVGAMIWGSETQRQDALVINLAGRQRMLAQQMTRLALEADSRKSAVDAALLEAEAVFDRTLYALREGGAAPYPPDASVTLQRPTDPRILSALDQVAQTWSDFRTQLYKLQWASRSNPIFWLTRQTFEDEAATLVEAADAVVRLLEADATAKINRLRAMQMSFLVGALVLLGVGAWVTHRSALTPLKGPICRGGPVGRQRS
ncbi:MAG: type IV pili methyl-accepting chemotaxis transducer N-terminal domain-containing protein [Anaerolineae bacterium]